MIARDVEVEGFRAGVVGSDKYFDTGLTFFVGSSLVVGVINDTGLAWEVGTVGLELVLQGNGDSCWLTGSRGET